MNNIDKLKAVIPSIPEIAPNLQQETDASMCGSCPNCGGSDRFVYKIDEKKFWCRNCLPKGGDVVDLHCLVYNTTVAALYKKYNISDDSTPALFPTPTPTHIPSQDNEKQPSKKNLYTPQKRWNDILSGGNTNLDPVHRLLHKRRNISKKTILQAFKDNKLRFIKHQLKGFDELSSVAFPYSELKNKKKVLAVQCLSVSGASYSEDNEKNKVFVAGSKAKENCFFQAGVDIDQAKIIILCEAVINALSCVECCPEACILALGSATSAEKVKVLREYRDKGAQIICFFDNDKDGRKITQKVAVVLGAQTNEVIWEKGTPNKYDVNDLLKADKHKIITEMVKNAKFVEINDSGTDEESEAQIEELNKTHAIIRIGSKVRILDETLDIEGKPDIQFLSDYDLRLLYSNRKISNPLAGQKGQPEQINLAKAWLDSPTRREYKGIVFKPGVENDNFYNLYKGLNYEPVKGDWSLFRQHIFDNICSKNMENFDWLIAWLARIVQHPGGKKPGTAVVLRGERGTGKGVFVEVFGKIFGHHFLQVTNSKQAVGKFNAHLKDCILLFLDEAWFAGDKSSEGVLKGLITSDRHMVEFKGKDSVMVSNHVNCIVASNSSWVVPVGNKERRFFVLDVLNKHIQDHKYFERISKQMYENGGIEAMLYDLLNINISKYNLREAPKTKGLFEQLMQNFSSFEKFWFEMLLSNFDFNDEIGVQTAVLYDKYTDFCRKLNIKYIITASVFGRNLSKYCDISIERKYGLDNLRHRFYIFPGKQDCKYQFSRQIGMEIPWDERKKQKIEIDIDEI